MRNYATQMDAAKRGIVTPEIETVARKENRPVEFIMERVAKGTIAIPANINHKSLSAEAVGDGTRVKINVNLGISGDCKDYEMELRKVRMATVWLRQWLTRHTQLNVPVKGVLVLPGWTIDDETQHLGSDREVQVIDGADLAAQLGIDGDEVIDDEQRQRLVESLDRRQQQYQRKAAAR